ncbi:hypothetical protein [Nonomuraea recticatena]|uniref:hypothetical protein n=1 Tax=Nonomuraea recticatena TaxID=46178 RepID=UPI00361F4475
MPLAAAAKPDLPGTAAGVPEGYFTYPKELFRSVAKPPMSGGKVTMASKTFLPPPRRASRTPRGRRSRSGSAARRTC